MTTAPFDSYRAQGWAGETRTMEIEGLSIDAARHIAQVHAMIDGAGRVMAEHHDYVEVYTADGTVRRGTFAQTTLAHVPVRS